MLYIFHVCNCLVLTSIYEPCPDRLVLSWGYSPSPWGGGEDVSAMCGNMMFGHNVMNATG